MSSRSMGIPDLKVRVDDSETARQWNRLREGVISLHNTPDPFERGPAVPQFNGFSPIALRYYENPESLAEYTPGVGRSVGRLYFLQTPSIIDPGVASQAVEVIPTLGGDSLDEDVAPREELTDGDWEAWVIYKEISTTHEARIAFSTLDAGPGTMDRDEKAVRLATFLVRNNTANTKAPPLVHVYDHIIRDSLAVPLDSHQFRAYKTADDKIKVSTGFVIYAQGQDTPLVSSSTEVSESAEFTITEAGSIWLQLQFQVAQHSQTTVAIPGPSGSGDPEVTLTMYRLNSISSPTFEFRTAAPTMGTNATNLFTYGYFYYEICRLSFAAGETFIADQIVNGPIYVNELTDGKLTIA